jgi:hypothetical protein
MYIVCFENKNTLKKPLYYWRCNCPFRNRSRWIAGKLFKTSAGIEPTTNMFAAFQESMEESKKRRNDRSGFWSTKQLTDSSSIEKWLQARKKIGECFGSIDILNIYGWFIPQDSSSSAKIQVQPQNDAFMYIPTMYLEEGRKFGQGK